MAQFGFPDLSSPTSGAELIDDSLEPAFDAIYTGHSGTSRPSYCGAGMTWVNTTTDPWILNLFDGSNDIPLGTFNITTNVFTASGIGTLIQGYNANLASLAGLTLAADKLAYANGVGSLALTDLKSAARTLLADVGNGYANIGDGTLSMSNVGKALLSGGTPQLLLVESDQAAGSRVWAVGAAAQNFSIRKMDDAFSTQKTFLDVASAAGLVTGATFSLDSGDYTFGVGRILAALGISFDGGTSVLKNFAEGTYTPTLTNTTNVAASTASVCHYTRIGNRVFVAGRVAIDATTTNIQTDLNMSLPIASTFAAITNLGGAAYAGTVTRDGFGISAGTASTVANTARFLGFPTSTANETYYFEFMYMVI